MQCKTRLMLIALLLMSSLVGCYESPNVTLYEPGEYKGHQDPLLQKQRSAEQQQRLRQRFGLVQTDR